jgi:hypothetical protein
MHDVCFIQRPRKIPGLRTFLAILCLCIYALLRNCRFRLRSSRIVPLFRSFAESAETVDQRVDNAGNHHQKPEASSRKQAKSNDPKRCIERFRNWTQTEQQSQRGTDQTENEELVFPFLWERLRLSKDTLAFYLGCERILCRQALPWGDMF